MNMSPETKDLFAAFVKFQGELGNALKLKTGHGYKYADLVECISTAKEPLEKYGLAVIQTIGQSESGVVLNTMLIHESGQWINNEFVMERAVLQGGAGKNPAQNMGASITYMRRYAYAAILGMAQEDNDASHMSHYNYEHKAASPVTEPKKAPTDEQIEAMKKAVIRGEKMKVIKAFQNYIIDDQTKNEILAAK